MDKPWKPGRGPNDPTWVVGCIDSYGAITARICKPGPGNSIMHGVEESRGTRWRWNIQAQEFGFTLMNEPLSDEQTQIVLNWLEHRNLYNSNYGN